MCHRSRGQTVRCNVSINVCDVHIVVGIPLTLVPEESPICPSFKQPVSGVKHWKLLVLITSARRKSRFPKSADITADICFKFTAPIRGHIVYKNIAIISAFHSIGSTYNCQATLSKNCQNDKLLSSNFHRCTIVKNAKFDLFGITECQLATSCYSSK